LSSGHLVPLGSYVPRPHPAFRHLQYGKVGRAWYLFSHEHDIINKWQKKKNEKANVQPTRHSILGVYDRHPLLARYVWLSFLAP